MNYPTKDEILNAIANHEPVVSKNDIQTLNEWRKSHRGELLTHDTLTDLINQLGVTRSGDTELKVKLYPEYAYDHTANTIYLGEKPSIISTLHEYAHSLFGSSELKACAWSIAMFSTVYPKAYAKLEWKGHMLVKAENRHD